MKKKGHYPIDVIFATVVQADDGPRNAAQGAIQSEADLKKVLGHLAPMLAGSVNFEKEQLIYLALGLSEAGRHETQINAVSYVSLRNDGLPPLITVSYREIASPVLRAEEKSNPICPIHVIKLKKLDGEIVFKKYEKG